jgi:uncharacterized protein (DUF934 family)
MSKIIRDGAIVVDDWAVLRADDSLSLPTRQDAPRLIVPLKVWQLRREEFLARDGQLGLWLQTDDEPAPIGVDVTLFQLIAIHFGKFTDGRGYSLARLLRERYRYTNELRATGDVLQDQLFYLKRSGFNAFAIRADKNIEAALKSLNDFSESYQGAWEQPLPLFKRRHFSTAA